MKYLRQSMIAFFIVVTVFYNIERLDLGRQNLINLETFVYALGAGAVLLIITCKGLRTLSISTSIALWLGLYFVSKLLLWGERPLLGGVYTYITVTEISLLALLIWLAYRLVSGIEDFEKGVKNITFAGSDDKVRQLDEVTEVIQTEMFRSRHNHHPLSVIIVEPNSSSLQSTLSRIVREVQQTMLANYIFNNLARVLSSHLRRSDLVLEQKEKNRLVLVCPDTNSRDAAVLIEYIEEIVAQRFEIAVTCGAASFPQEEVTFEELVRCAEVRLAGSPSPSPPSNPRPVTNSRTNHQPVSSS